MTLTEIKTLAAAAESAAEELREALREYFDEKPEAWQASDAGDDWMAHIDLAEDARADLDAIVESLA